jgi:hypothetical protein
MEIYLKHPLVVWCMFVPIAFVLIVGTVILLVLSLLPSPMVQDLVARFSRKGRSEVF